MTKTLDELMFAFYARNDGLRITDLHQGIVWGTQTKQTELDERLINRFDYDAEYGTVLNRFLVQAAIGHPLTGHGLGWADPCVHPDPRHGPLHRDRDHQPAGDRLASDGAQPGHRNPPGRGPGQGSRKHYWRRPGASAESASEADDNDLVVRNEQFLALGLEPTELADPLLDVEVGIAERYKDRVNLATIVSQTVWRKGMESIEDVAGLG